MRIQKYLKTLNCRPKSNSRRGLARTHEMSEHLESRTLLTGNVQVSFAGSHAQITGDAANNEIEVIIDNGSVVVRGLNGTTINLGTTVFTLATGATTFQGNLTASLGNGDDILTVGPGIAFTGNVSLAGDDGTDTLRALTGTYGGNLKLTGNAGASSMVVDGATVSGNLDVRGQGATLASLSNSTVHGSLRVQTGGGADSVVIQSTTVDGMTFINTGEGNDNVVLQNSTLRDRLGIEAGTGDDVVYINSSSVARVARIALRGGNDTAQVLGSSTFGKRLVIAGGRGSDAASVAADTTARRIVRHSINSNQVDAALISSRITDPITGAIARANALRTAAVPTLTVTASPATFSETAGTTASTLTVTRTGSTTVAQIVTLTSSNPSKATVPTTVTILAGQTTATATIAAIDNNTADGAATVTITATATGFVNATTTLTVNDNEPALSLTASPATFSETAGTTASTLTVTRTGSTTDPEIIGLISSDPSKVTVPAVVTILAGQTTATATLAAIDNNTADGTATVTITATATGFVNATTTLTVNDNEPALTAIFSAPDAVQSNGTKITRDATSQVTGMAIPGAAITVDSNDDGIFDNGSGTAGPDGSYTVDVTLSHTVTNHGANELLVRAVFGTSSADVAVAAHLAVGTVVHFATNLGSYDVELLDVEAPLTVANFLSYVDSGAYQDMFVHRANSGSAKFIQGGGFKVLNGQVSSVVTTAAIVNEFKAENSNGIGTLAMALAANINTGTSQWFVNTSDNGAGFDPGQYTVFGRVIGDGVTVARQISDLPQQNLNTLYSSSAFATVPLSSFNPSNTLLTGNVATIANSLNVTGTGTQFTSELAVGQSIVLGSGRAYFVASIASNTSLTLTTTAQSTATNIAVSKDVVPTDAEFVVFSSIGKILDTI
ncbi:MAG: hypothetical protein DWI22_18050 [Planctomycetota bacterium]|nr:MAG: hypothetical protein DWI22_18050 [Planctomycetota bacterium]